MLTYEFTQQNNKRGLSCRGVRLDNPNSLANSGRCAFRSLRGIRGDSNFCKYIWFAKAINKGKLSSCEVD